MSTSNIRSRAYIASVLAAALVFTFNFAPTNLMAASDTFTNKIDQDTLTTIAELYSISEEAAVDRLARETEAAIILKQINSLSISSYAGSWFDESSMRLKVAVADPKDLAVLELFKVDTVVVNHSRSALQNILEEVVSRLKYKLNLEGSLVTSFVDYRLNNVVLEVESQLVDAVNSELQSNGFSEVVTVIRNDGHNVLSTGSVRGSDGTRNLTWQQDPGGVWPCSIGA